MLIRIRDNWGKEYRVEDSEVGQFAEQMKGEGRHFAPVRTLVNPKTGEEWDGVQWNEKAKEGKQPWEARAIDDENAAFSGYLKEGWQYKQWEEPDAWEKVKGFFDEENFKDPTGQQNDLEYNAKNVAAGVGSAVVSGVTGLANAIQGTVLNAAAFASRALGAEDAADAIADVRKETGENIRAMRDKATDAIIEGLDAQGMKDARDLVDTGLDVVEGFSGLYGLGAAVGGATKGIVKLAGSMGKTVDAAKVGGTVLAGQMGADAYEHALEEMEAQEETSGKEISGLQKTIVAGARAAMSAATSKLFGKIAGIGIPKETAQKVVERSLGQSARVLVQEMGEFAAINDLNVLADEAGRWAADVDRLDPEKGIGARILEESLHGAGMVLGMKSQKILKGAWNALMPERQRYFTEAMNGLKRAELGAIDKVPGVKRVVHVMKDGTGVLADGGIVRAADGEIVSPDGMIYGESGFVKTVAAGRCGELSDGEYGIPGAGNGERRFGGDLTENACKLVALAEEGLVETRKIPLDALPGDAKSGENGIRLRLKEDGTTELVSDIPESEQKKPVVVFEREDGTFSLVTGRKRVAAGKTAKNGEIEAVVIREKDGWTEDTARVVDVVDNLMKGSPVSDTEAMTAANALGIGYKRAEEWGLTANKNVAAAFRMRENASAELEGMVTEGSVRLESADAIAQNANKSNMPGASAEHIATIQTELAVKMELGTPDEIAVVCRKLRETDMSPEEAMDPIARSRKINEAIAAAERERLEEAAKKSGLTPDQEAKVQNTPVEREDGTLTTVRATEEADRQAAEQKRTPDGEPSTKLTVQGDRVTCARFPEVELMRPEAEGGIAALRGLTATEMLKPENREAVTDLLEEIGRTVGEFAISGEAEMAAAQELLSARVAKRRLEAEQMRRDSIKEALEVLAGSGLAKAVHTDQESFEARLKQGKGIEQWLTDTDEVWGFTDGNEIWLNPKTARLETPIHEYGHLGIAMCKKVNREVYDRGIALAKEIGLFKEISENEAYKNSSEESRAEEVLATIIGKRGEEALKGAPETLKAKVKEWLVDFWKAFGEALGLRDITPEQAAKMTLEEVADAIRAEMMSGKRFGEKAESGQAERSSAINTGGMRFSLEMKKQKGNPAVKEVAARIKGLLTGKIARTDSTIAYKESETDNRRLGTEAAKIYERYVNKEYKLPTGGVLYFAPDIRTVNAYNGDVAAAWGEYALHLITHTRGSGENRFRSFDGRNVDVILPMIENIIKENKVAQSDGRIIFFKQTRKAESKSKSRYAYIVTEPDDAGNLRVDLRYITGVEGRGFLPGKTATLEEVIPNRTAEGRALHQNHKSGRIPGQLTTLRDALPTGHAKGIAAAAERTREEEAVINLYSDREGGNPGHKASPGVKTTSSTPQIVSQEGGGKQEGLKYSIGGIFTGSAADYANRSREGGGDHKWTDGELKFSVKMIGTDEGVYKTSIDTKNPKTKDGRNTVIFRRDPRECDALLVESETIKAVEKALPENIKTGDKSIKYTESERIAVRNFVKEKAKAQRGEVQNPEFGEIYIGLDFVKEVQAHAISTAREIAAVSSAREIAEKMRHFAASPNEEIKRGKNKYIEYGLATFEFQGERYLVMGEVGIRNNAKPYYDQRIVAKIKAETSPSLHAHIETESAFDEVYDNRFRILMQAAQEAENNREVMMQVRRQELPTADGEDVAAWLLNGRLRLADDAKYGLAERRLAEHSSAISAPIEVMTPSGDLKVMKPVEFAFSSLVELYQWMRGSPALPKILTKAHQEKRAWLGRITKGSEVELNPEMFGIVSKSDEARIKAELKAEGRFRNEDPGWNMRHTKKQNDNERHMSENLLEDRLRSLAEDRVKGKAGGEYAAPAAALAHEVAALAMEMPANAKMPEIARALRTLGNGIVKIFEKDAAYIDKWKKSGFKVTEVEGSDSMLAEAIQAVAWWRGYEGGVRQARDGRGKLYEYKTAEDYFKNNHKELCAEVMGMFLTAPEELSNRALGLYYEIVERLAGDQKLLDAYNRLTEGYSGSGPAEKVMRKIEAQWTHEAQMEIAKLEKELDKPLGSGIQRAKRRVILNLHSKEGVAVSVVGDGLRENVAAAKRAWKRGDISKADFEAVRKDAKDTLRDLKLGVLKKQRGGGRDRVYALDFLGKVMGDIERDGIDLADFRRYLKAQRVIETQGRAMDFGMSPSEAQKVLDGLREKFGDGGMTYRKIEAAAMRYRAVREKNVLDDEYIVEAFGKARIDAWKRNVHYVRTQRTVSAEEAEAHNKTLDGMKRADPLTELEMLMDLHHRKHRSTHGDTFMEPLTGSLKATEDPLQATLANDIRMMAFARRNHLMVQLADIARREKLEGWKEVHDKAGEIRLDRSERYGSVSFLRDGERKLLIMPKVVAEGFKHAASDVAGMVKANRMLSAVLTQYSARFAVRNLSRNRASTEINVPWMGESRFVRGARFAGMGPAARVAEILMEWALVRLPDRYSRNVAANLLWGEHTNMYWMAEATRIAELMQNPKGFRELAEKADQYAANGEYGKAKQILEDIEKAREIMKHPIFAGHWEMTRGTTERTDLDEVFRSLDIRTKIEDVPLKNLKKLARGLADAANAIKRFNTFEESRIKIVSILAAERAKLRAKERGGNWKYDNGDIDYISATMAGSPRYENRGRWMNVLEAISLGPFVNVSMKGALRTFESMKIDPAAWWSKAAQRYAGRMAEVALWSGGGYAFVAQVARRLFEDDEDAQRAIDGFERFGKRMARARACTSDYRIRNYDVMPLGLYGKYSAFGINIPRGDEDRLFTPMTDLFAQYLLGTEAAKKVGLQEPMEGAYEGVFQTLATTATGSGLAPDLMRGSMIWNLGRDVFYSWFNNPYNTFTQRPLYDENLWKERWNRPAEFLKATLKQAWNDVGGQVVLPATTWDEDEGEVPDDGKWVMSIAEDKEQTEMPIGGKTVFRALHYVPLASAALSGVFYMNCDGDKRIARRLATMLETEKAVRDRVAMQCVEMQLKHEDTAVDYSPILDKAIEENGWDGSDRAMIEQAITRKLNFMSRKLGKQDTPILELMSRKNMSRAERERAKRYLIGIGWKGPEE